MDRPPKPVSHSSRLDRKELTAKQFKNMLDAMPPGDWLCPVCVYTNFARTWGCRKCGEPKEIIYIDDPEMRDPPWLDELPDRAKVARRLLPKGYRNLRLLGRASVGGPMIEGDPPPELA